MSGLLRMQFHWPAGQLGRGAQLAALGLLSALSLGCSPHKVETNPAPPVGAPETFGGEAAEAALPDQWWNDFGDATLNGLIEEALTGNFELQGAWARLTQAEAGIRTARSARWPVIDGQAQVGRADRFFPPFGKITQETYALSLPVSYEVDIWNKYGSGIDAASAQAQASRDDLEATALTLAAEVSEAWFDVVNGRAIDKLLRTQLEANEQTEELLETRFSRGLAEALDVYQQRQQVLATKNQLEQNLTQLEMARNRLGILLGRARDDSKIPEVDSLPVAPAMPGVGVPADLLERRPDLRSARSRLVAQDHLLAQAIAERLPGVQITASLGFSASNPRELLDNLLTSLAGSLMVPILDGGRRAAKAQSARGAVAETLAAYGQTLLRAIAEVENALVQDAQQEKIIEILEAQQLASESALREAKSRYIAGVTDYLRVLTALVSLQGTERNLLDAHRQRLSIRIQLFRALGGTWTATLQRPEPQEES